MKRLFILLAAAVLLMSGCGAQPQADGRLENGGRVISISSGFTEVYAYRGETVTLTYTGSGSITLDVPNFEAEASGNGKVQVQLKAVETGCFDISVTTEGGTEKGKLIVEELAETDIFKSVDTQEFQAAMTGDYLLLDVRTQEEYDNGHIEGALLIPHTELAERLNEVEGYSKVLVYCASGNRSVSASQILIDAGYKEVYNLKGGFSAWQAGGVVN